MYLLLMQLLEINETNFQYKKAVMLVIFYLLTIKQAKNHTGTN